VQIFGKLVEAHFECGEELQIMFLGLPLSTLFQYSFTVIISLIINTGPKGIRGFMTMRCINLRFTYLLTSSTSLPPFVIICYLLLIPGALKMQDVKMQK